MFMYICFGEFSTISPSIEMSQFDETFHFVFMEFDQYSVENRSHHIEILTKNEWTYKQNVRIIKFIDRLWKHLLVWFFLISIYFISILLLWLLLFYRLFIFMHEFVWVSINLFRFSNKMRTHNHGIWIHVKKMYHQFYLLSSLRHGIKESRLMLAVFIVSVL